MAASSNRSSRRSRGRRRRSVVLAMLAVSLVAGCSESSPSTSANSPSDAEAVNFLMEFSPTNLDPRIGTDAQSEHLHGLLFDSLVARDANLNITPDLATT